MELHAYDADVVLLLGAILAPGEILAIQESKKVSGRLTASDRASTRATLLALAEDLPRKMSSVPPSGAVDLSHYRKSAAHIAEQSLGRFSPTWRQRGELPISLFARGVDPPAAANLALELADLEWVDMGTWATVAKRGNQPLMKRLARTRGPRLHALFEGVRVCDALNLIHEVTAADFGRTCRSAGALWLQAHDQSLGQLLARLAAVVDQKRVDYSYTTDLWDGARGLAETDSVVGIVQLGSKAAALLRTGGGVEILRPGRFTHGVVAIDPTSVSITYNHVTWTDDIQPFTVIEPDKYDSSVLVSADRVLATLDTRRWRLAATLRIDTEWRALLVSPELEWAWLDSRVASIEPGAVSLANRRLELLAP